MAYPIKNAVSTRPNSIYVNNYGNVGVNQGGYGKTSVTGYWNGKTPNIGGYVTYVGNANSSPTMYISTNDAELITLSYQLGGTGYSTIGYAIEYLNYFLIDGLCVNSDVSNVVTTDLLFYLDAGYLPSYPGVSIYWFNLAVDGLISGSLTNGPTYDSANYGSIVFDGTNQYVDCYNTIQSFSQITMDVWVKFSGLDYTYGTGNLQFFMSKGNPDSSSPNNGFWFAYDNRSNQNFFTYTCFGNSAGGFAGGGNNFSSKSYTFTNNVWYNITATVNSSSQGRLYINGVQQGSSVTFSNLNMSDTGTNLIVGNATVSSYAYCLKGYMSQTKIYNRALSSAEVLQNYYAGMKRFIPTSNLITWLDGENTNTRVITPVTAYDVSGNNYDGSLVNGTSLRHWDAGTSFYFDGNDDYINCGNIMPSSDYTKVVIFKLQSLGYSNNLMSGNNHFLYLAGGAFLRAGHFVSGEEAISSYTTIVNTWNFAVVTFNSTNGFRIYQNGTTVVGSTSSAAPSAGGNVLLGSVLSGGSYVLQGQIGIAMLYNRVLTTSEISDIYLAYKGRFGYV